MSITASLQRVISRPLPSQHFTAMSHSGFSSSRSHMNGFRVAAQKVFPHAAGVGRLSLPPKGPASHSGAGGRPMGCLSAPPDGLCWKKKGAYSATGAAGGEGPARVRKANGKAQKTVLKSL
ncbi:hypothetical protein AAFF_G00065280 [Aldrovandia affinis]|uniref:Uncharacterized protein n=1 Tax=Aldrovandia affinis TaxID=143900 RepID=A0AAD7T3V1_9TELE|nr:hypothetical protein AAFF_G00065280 [Aldrovandia affinis]